MKDPFTLFDVIVGIVIGLIAYVILCLALIVLR
jgi:hypothetical protein